MKLALMSQASLGTGEFTQYPVLFCKLGNLFRSNPGYGHILGNLLEEEAPYTTFSKRAQRALSVLELYVDWERNASPKWAYLGVSFTDLFSFLWISAFPLCLFYSLMIDLPTHLNKLVWLFWLILHWLRGWDIHINDSLNYLQACRWAPWSNSMALFEQRIHQPCILKLEAMDEAESSKKGSWI